MNRIDLFTPGTRVLWGRGSMPARRKMMPAYVDTPHEDTIMRAKLIDNDRYLWLFDVQLDNHQWADITFDTVVIDAVEDMRAAVAKAREARSR